MPIFLWEGVTKKNDVKKGEMEAIDGICHPRSFTSFRDLNRLEVKKKPKDLTEYLPFLKGKIKEKM